MKHWAIFTTSTDENEVLVFNEERAGEVVASILDSEESDIPHWVNILKQKMETGYPFEICLGFTWYAVHPLGSNTNVFGPINIQ